MQLRSLSDFGRRAMFLGLLASIATPAVFAQPRQEQQWTTVMYRKTQPGKAAEHRKFIETTWKKLAQAMVDEGVTKGAVAMRLTQPYVSTSEFDYAFISFAATRPSLAQVPETVLDARAKKAGFESWQKFVDASAANSKIVKQEWLTTRMRLGMAQPGNYMRLVRYQVDREHMDAVNQFMEEYQIPLNTARIKQGGLAGFSVHRPAMVSFDEAGFTHSVSVILKDADAVMAGPGRLTEEAFKKALPGKNFVEYITQRNSISAMRKIVATRVYEVVAVVGSMPQAGSGPSSND